MTRALAALAAGLGCVLSAGDAAAHALAPALLEIAESGEGRFDVRWKVSLLKPTGANVRPLLPDHCRATSESSFHPTERDVSERWRVDCGERGLVGSTLQVQGLDESRTDALLHVSLADGRTVRGLLNARTPSFVVPERESAWAVARSYGILGTEHLLFGLDHVLFVLGLVLLVRGWRTLIATISAFTLGHSITLSLATLGVVQVPSGLFEVLIAISILVLGAELARGSSASRPSALRRRPWLMACGFGLLHGLGFAGALSEIGLPSGEIPLALLAFNVGVELGQLAIVLPVALAGALARDWVERLPPAALRVPAYAIGSLAGYWTIDRALSALG